MLTYKKGGFDAVKEIIGEYEVDDKELEELKRLYEEYPVPDFDKLVYKDHGGLPADKRRPDDDLREETRECFKCGVKGHLAFNCPQGNRGRQ